LPVGNYKLVLIDVATTTSENWAGRQGGDDKQSGNSPGLRSSGKADAYKWVALSNTTLAMVMATIDGSIVIVALPAIFRGINLNPLTPGNVTCSCSRSSWSPSAGSATSSAG
jgi:hypothetical protein